MPRSGPCGTPYFILENNDVLLLEEIHCLFSDIEDINQVRVRSHIPNWISSQS